MPKDFNRVHLCGIIGEDYKYGKTQNGSEYATFSLCLNSYDKEEADSTERKHPQVFIRIFVYDKRQVEYLKRMKAHQGMRLYVNGRLSSLKNEYKGVSFMTNNVVCRDLGIIQTK